MGRTKAEQETIIRWDEEEQTLDIYTASERVTLRLQRTPQHEGEVRAEGLRHAR